MGDFTWFMDESTMDLAHDSLRDGFAGQRMLTLPRPAVRAALQRPVTSRLLVTDAGFFPHAARHGRSRPQGAGQHIVLICTDGFGWCRIPEAKLSLQRGDAVVIPAAVAHEYGASEERPWTLWWLHVVGADAPELVRAARAAARGPVSHLRDPAPFAGLVSQAIDALDLGTAGGLVRASGAAWNLLAQLIATGRRTRGASRNPIEQATDHLRATSPNRTPIATLASMAGLSTSQFTALFKQQMGVPPLRYQSDLRMAKARELLDSTDLPVAVVAVECGYDDPLYFSRQFTRTHQQSPTAYRVLRSAELAPALGVELTTEYGG